MTYDRAKRCFVFANKAEVRPTAMVFYDLPALLSPGEEICEELAKFAESLPRGASETCHIPAIEGALPHQVYPVLWLLSRKLTGIIAYGMGLGKTFIACRACDLYGRRRVLVVCPPHLKANWRNEITMWLPGTEAHVCAGRESDMSETAEFTVCSCNLLADNLAALRKQGFDQIVVDEVHKCGGWGTASYKALDALCADVRKRLGGVLLMSGTLFKNSPMDAHTALNLLDPRIPGPRAAFELRFDPVGALKKEVVGLMARRNAPRWLIAQKWAEIKKREKEAGRHGDVEGLRWLLSQYAIRKTYAEVFPEDGKSRETKFVNVDLELTDRQRRILEKGAVDDCDGRPDGDLATVLRVVAERKAPFVADWAENWLEEHEGEKLVIATWHIDAREIIKKALERYGVVEIAGSPKQKEKAERLFADVPENRVCVLNLDSGGTGLNLVSASCMIFSEVPWTSAAYEQVKARIDRIGQTAVVLSYVVFLASGTPEGAKFGTMRKKAGLNDRYL